MGARQRATPVRQALEQRGKGPQTMQTEAAILWEMGGDWKVETIELDPPKAGEVLVRIAASGMCHSDEHLRTGDPSFGMKPTPRRTRVAPVTGQGVGGTWTPHCPRKLQPSWMIAQALPNPWM